MIHRSLGADAFALLRNFVKDFAVEPAYRSLFELALEIAQRDAEKSSIFAPVDLPATAAGLLGLPDSVAVLSAALSTLVWSGADLLDDGADEDLCDRWAGNSPHQIALVATNLLSTLPHTLLGRQAGFGPDAATYSQALARTLFTMSEGQWADLGSPATVTNLDEYMAVIRRKSGAEFALFASTPALLAGLDQTVSTAWMGFGMAYGVMLQAFGDALSTQREGEGNDLLGGKRSLSVLHLLTEKSGAEHTKICADLDLVALGDHSGLARLRQAMVESGSLRFAKERCELLRYRAAEAFPARLADLPMDHAARILLRAFS